MDVNTNRVGGYQQQVAQPRTPAVEGEAVAPAPVPQSAPPPPVRQEREERHVDELRVAVREINGYIADRRRHLDIRFHEPTNRRIVTVYDSDTNEAVREIPPERVLEAHANMLELAGIFINTVG